VVSLRPQNRPSTMCGASADAGTETRSAPAEESDASGSSKQRPTRAVQGCCERSGRPFRASPQLHRCDDGRSRTVALVDTDDDQPTVVGECRDVLGEILVGFRHRSELPLEVEVMTFDQRRRHQGSGQLLERPGCEAFDHSTVESRPNVGGAVVHQFGEQTPDTKDRRAEFLGGPVLHVLRDANSTFRGGVWQGHADSQGTKHTLSGEPTRSAQSGCH